MRLRMVCIMVLLAAACERTPPEPTLLNPSSAGVSSLAHGNTKQSASAPPSGTAAATGTSVAVPKPRCVVPLPAKPSRPPVSGVAADCPDDPTGRLPLDTAQLKFERAGVAITAEIARSDPERMRGLMFRKELREDEGMVFLFKRTSRHRFWMKNTCLPLDMMFVDSNGFIVGVEENVPTLNTNSYFVRCDSQYVIEVNAGWTRRHGVKPGDRVIMPK